MQRRQSLTWLAAGIWAGCSPLVHAYRPAPAPYRNALPRAQGQRLSVEVLGGPYQRRYWPIFQHRQRWYVGGEHDQPYQLLLRNNGPGRVLVVISVDGVNVLSGEPAATDQPGYILPAHGSVRVAGWRKSLNSVAQFVFTTPDDSYAERTGQGGNTGVLGFAVFEEAPPMEHRRRDWDPVPPHAPSAAGAERRSDMGTGHGEEVTSTVREARFQRRSSQPSETLQLHYASLWQLERRGIAERHHAPEHPSLGPNPFPGERRFVPDPPPRR